MDPHVIDVMEECTRASDEERISFPQVVMALMEAGVERYHADLVRTEKTYYLPDGSSHRLAAHAIDESFAATFSPSGVEDAIRRIQRGEIGYREFCTRIAAAGCVEYVVSIVGRRAVYFGRTAESHVEPFPPAR